MPCPCGAPLPIEACCGVFISGQASAPTAEASMKSRYSAYATGAIDYLVRTHRPNDGQDVDPRGIADFARQSNWRGLTIHATERGGIGDDEGVVEFSARFVQRGRPHTMRERSRFQRIEGAWYYVGQEPISPRAPVRAVAQPSRNGLCPCGSKKKYKRCCLTHT
jgi:SEC-C motif-containing protein